MLVLGWLHTTVTEEFYRGLNFFYFWLLSLFLWWLGELFPFIRGEWIQHCHCRLRLGLLCVGVEDLHSLSFPPHGATERLGLLC
jgi:hypothetical protein